MQCLFEDTVFEKYVHIPVMIGDIIPWAVALLVIFYGLYHMYAHKMEAAI